jgi:hypothetical protein
MGGEFWQTAVAQIRLRMYNKPCEQSKGTNLYCDPDLRPAGGLHISRW